MANVIGKDNYDEMPQVTGIDIVPSGGTVGQVLTKDTGTDYDYSWQDGSDPDAATAAANLTDNSIVRGDGGAKGLQDSDGTGSIDWTISDSGQMVGVGDISGDYVLTVRNLNATSGDGFRVQAGEALGDIAFSIEDSDGSFNIMQLEANQGHVTFGKTYAQTLIDNGTVYGVDIQNTGAASDFNSQAGTYRIGGVDVIVPSGGTTGQVLTKSSGTDYDMQWTVTGSILQLVTAAVGTGSTTAEHDENSVPTIATGIQISSLSITPTVASHKIELNWHFVGDISADRAFQVFVFRDSTFIGFDTVNGWKRGYFGTVSGEIIDSPNTTSAVTYSIRIAISPSGTVYYGQNENGDNLGGTLAATQFFTAKEIKIGSG